MFDGATLTGWQADEHPESWKVVDGAIVGDGPTSHLFWMVRECDDCGFRAEVKLKPQRKLRHVSTQDVIVDGNHFIIKVNDKVVTDCTGPKNRYAKGYLALQQHNPGSIVQFRNLLMRPLAAGK
jgi:hypothetical protein